VVGDGGVALDWLGRAQEVSLFTLEWAATGDFSSKETLYRGPLRNHEDDVDPPANGVWYYRVK
jgi:hypothetical protein